MITTIVASVAVALVSSLIYALTRLSAEPRDIARNGGPITVCPPRWQPVALVVAASLGSLASALVLAVGIDTDQVDAVVVSVVLLAVMALLYGLAAHAATVRVTVDGGRLRVVSGFGRRSYVLGPHQIGSWQLISTSNGRSGIRLRDVTGKKLLTVQDVWTHYGHFRRWIDTYCPHRQAQA